MEHVAGHFEKCSVRLDGNSYRKCTFKDVVFDYAGGPIVFDNNTLQNCSWNLGGDLARGLTVMLELFGPDDMLKFLRQAAAGGVRRH